MGKPIGAPIHIEGFFHWNGQVAQLGAAVKAGESSLGQLAGAFSVD